MSPQIERLRAQLDGIRSHYGEDAYKRAAQDVAKMLVAQGGETEATAREMFEGIVDFEHLGEIPVAGAPVSNPIVDAVRQQMPHLRSQAQFDAFMLGFDAFRAFIDAIYAGDKEGEASSKVALDKAIEGCRTAGSITQKLEDVPEASTSKEAEKFKQPPAQFTEAETLSGLLEELVLIQTATELNDWYTGQRSRMDRVVTQKLRDQLFDAIRKKKEDLAA
jgi:hypothetical protein